MTSPQPDRENIARRIRRRPVPIKKPSLGSAAFRLHQMFGESPATWENRMCGEGSVYRRVAQINGTLRVMGLLDKLTELMMPVELSLGPDPQAKAAYREAVTDAEEDVLQAHYRDHPCEQTARALLRKRAVMRAASMDEDREIAALFGITL